MAFDGTLKFDTAIDQTGFSAGIEKLGSIAKTGMKVVGAAITAASGAVAALGKQALDSYADYEQLTGGIATLFGAQEMSLEEYAGSIGKTADAAKSEYDRLLDAQETVLSNAAAAFKTAGMSQNEYMETVTSFSAALISSLGGDTAKAAGIADMAIIDMADNANKMGSSMESIQNAYQGFAKQNYTMLDNLKLGYGGTKSEMERLLADAEAISGVHYDISSYSDIVEAIHAVQTEMGITGTTAKEAAGTIQGSVSSMKAAWDNLLVGIADDTQDFGKLTDDLVESAATAAENILPRVEIILGGVSNLVVSLSGVAAEAVTGLVSYLPDLIGAGVSLVDALVQGLTENAPAISAAVLDAGVQLAEAFISLAPGLVELGITLITTLADSLADAAPALLDSAAEGIAQIVKGLTINLPKLKDSAFAIISAIVTALTDNADMLIEGAVELIMMLAEMQIEYIGVYVDAVTRIITAIAEYLTNHADELVDAALEIITTLAGALIENIPTILSAIVQIGAALLSAVGQAVAQLWDYAVSWWSDITSEAFTALGEWLGSLIDSAVQGAKDLVNGAMKFLGELPYKLGVMLGEALGNIAKWALEAPAKAKEAASRFLDNVKTFFRELPGNAKNWLDRTIDRVTDWAKSLKDKGKNAAKDLVDSVVNGITSLPSKMLETGKNLVEGLWNGITGAGQWLKDKISSFGNGIIDGFKSAFGIASPSKVMRDSVGKYLAQGVGVGFTEEIPDIGRQAANVLTRLRFTPEVDVSAVSALHSAGTGINSTFAQSGAATEIISNQYSYSTVNNNTQQNSGAPLVLNAQFVVGDEIVAEGVLDIVDNEVDERQGLRVQMKKRGLAT